MVLGYAEGGELFEYILSKRYLKDQEGNLDYPNKTSMQTLFSTNLGSFVPPL